jgi:hypothetical protein
LGYEVNFADEFVNDLLLAAELSRWGPFRAGKFDWFFLLELQDGEVLIDSLLGRHGPLANGLQ